MNTFVKPAAFALALSLLGSSQLFAQSKSKTAPKEQKTENIIIRKNGEASEKVTIVIDGDKVTVNGKPVDQYKGKNIDIMREDIDMAMPEMPPMPEGGGWKMMNEDFMREIHSNKAFLGVMTKEDANGAKITELTKESAAENAGLKEGDIITKINDDKITDADDLYKAVGKYKPEDKVTITYKRDGKENTATACLGENKQVRAFSWKNSDENFDFKMAPPAARGFRGWNGDDNFWNDDQPRLGIQVQDAEDGKGVKVLDADEDEPAGKAGIEEDDIITQVNGKAIVSVEDFKEKMKEVKKGDTVKLTFLHNGKEQTAEVKFPKDLKTTNL